MASSSLIGAIVARWDQSIPDTLASGGLWPCQIPDDKTSLPFAVLWHEGEVPEWTTQDAYTEDGQVRFEVYSATLADAESIAARIKDTFDFPGNAGPYFSFSDGSQMISMTRVNYLVSLSEYRTAQAKVVYQVDLLYKTQLRRTLTTALQ